MTAWTFGIATSLPRHGAAWQDAAVLDVAFDLALAHGRCIGVRLPGADDEIRAMAEGVLVPEERAFAAGLTPIRRRTWVGGRSALRRALEVAGMVPPRAILPDDRKAPCLPEGIAGSISHKESLAVALVAREEGARVGVDVEIERGAVAGRRNVDIASHVLAEDELPELAALAEEERAREVLLRFSAKEAIYKALDPYVRRYVAFHEVSVTPREDGTAVVRQRLNEGQGQFAVEVTWRRMDDVVLTTARVRPLRGA
jgi:phosphopantetheine--protein transferase-like protein